MLLGIVSVTMQYVSTVTSKGQILIPGPIRASLGINPDDRVTFNITDNAFVAQKAPSIKDMFGYIKTTKKFSDKELDEVINEATADSMAETL